MGLGVLCWIKLFLLPSHTKIIRAFSWGILMQLDLLLKRWGGGDPSWPACKSEFNDCIVLSELKDLSYGGCQFTWANKQGKGNYITSKLDRALVNECWMVIFPRSFAYFCPSGTSGHSPCVVNLLNGASKSPKPFKYFNCWADHQDFLPLVQLVWCKCIKGSPMYRICCKLQALKPGLKSINRKHFSDISLRVNCAMDELDAIQLKLDKHPLDINLQDKERSLCYQFVSLCRAEESLAAQKSRVTWLSLGDSNNKYFFRTVNNNRNRSRIHCVTLEDGSVVTDPGEVKAVFFSTFEGILGKPFNDVYAGLFRIQGLITSTLSHE